MNDLHAGDQRARRTLVRVVTLSSGPHMDVQGVGDRAVCGRVAFW